MIPCLGNHSCVPTQVENSDYNVSGSITGTIGSVVEVTCDAGFGGGGAVTCETSGVFSVTDCEGNDPGHTIPDVYLSAWLQSHTWEASSITISQVSREMRLSDSRS